VGERVNGRAGGHTQHKARGSGGPGQESTDACSKTAAAARGDPQGWLLLCEAGQQHSQEDDGPILALYTHPGAVVGVVQWPVVLPSAGPGRGGTNQQLAQGMHDVSCSAAGQVGGGPKMKLQLVKHHAAPQQLNASRLPGIGNGRLHPPSLPTTTGAGTGGGAGGGQLLPAVACIPSANSSSLPSRQRSTQGLPAMRRLPGQTGPIRQEPSKYV